MSAYYPNLIDMALTIPYCLGLDTFWRADNRQWVYTVTQLVNWKYKSASGSIIAPIMFFIYVNKMQNIVTSAIKLFTDDTTFIAN